VKKYLKLLLLCGFCFLLGGVAYRYKGIFFSKTEANPIELANPEFDFSKLNIDTVRLSISDSDYAILKGNREKAIEKGILSKDYRDKVKAKWIVGKDTLKVDVRLKGDLSDHWGDTLKWSFRVKVKKGLAYDGMKSFNFQRPSTRGNLNEWFFHHLLKKHDLISLRYKFVHSFINGQDAGVYAIEEYFDKRLIENNSERVGITFRFNTSKYWHHKHGTNPNRFTGSPIEPFKIGNKDVSNPLFQQFIIVKELISAYSKGEIEISKVFDVRKLAFYMAIVDLTGHQHSSSIDNMKFYYNPVTSLIEPIGYDNSIIKMLSRESILKGRGLLGERREINEGEIFEYSRWYDLIFSDRKFYKEYIQALTLVSNESEIEQFFEDLRPKLIASEFWIQHNDPDYHFEGESILTSNAKFLQGFLTPVDGIVSYIELKDTVNGLVEIRMDNQHYTPFQLMNIKYKDSVIYKFPESHLIQSFNSSANSAVNQVIQLSKELVRKKNFSSKIKITYRMLGGEEIFETEPYEWDQNSQGVIERIIESRKSNYPDFAFLQVDEHQVTIPKGVWVIDHPLTIDSDRILFVEKGAHVEFKNGASIICYGGIKSLGSENEPVHFFSNEGGQGILVLNSKVRSSLTYTVFDGLSNFEIDNWKLPSAVTFYRSNVDLDYVRFNNNKRGDDYLNIFRSEFTLSNSSFVKTNADAFDGDFVTGQINNVNFDSIGNDALDFSGSSVIIVNSKISHVQDKAISGGERSYITASNVEISDCEIAINSKDDSHVDIEGSSINNCVVAYAVFMKKTEYGPAYINAIKVKTSGVETDFLLEENSFLYIDREPLSFTHSNVKDLLYGKQYGKSSK
jgi:hypothetical protein